MDQYYALILLSLFSSAIEALRDLQRVCALDKVRKRLGVSRVSLGSLSESVVIFDRAPLSEIAVEFGHTIRSKPNSRFAAVGQQITADRCYILDRGYITDRLWNAINAVGSSEVCRASDRTSATVTHTNELTEADRAASVISDEIVDLGWKSQHCALPDNASAC